MDTLASSHNPDRLLDWIWVALAYGIVIAVVALGVGLVVRAALAARSSAREEPGVLGYGEPASSVSWIAGPLAASVGFLAAFPITRGLRGANVAVGAGVAVCALALDQPLDARVNALATGAALIVLAGAPREAPDRYAGGWRSLLR